MATATVDCILQMYADDSMYAELTQTDHALQCALALQMRDDLRDFTPRPLNNCERMPLEGPEDSVVIKTTSSGLPVDMAFVSSDDRSWLGLSHARSESLAARISSQQKQGSIQAVFGTEPKLTAREFKLVDFPFPDFHPHGIGYFEDETHRLLFVVNHRRDGDAVESTSMHLAAVSCPFSFAGR
eukprot:m.362142 g.362142  ORF g.362142 m.362142 type:complete len:184 (+) comp56013_c1_seq12:323-874(+)